MPEITDFYHQPRSLAYSFPGTHPYNSGRLANAVELLRDFGLRETLDFDDATEAQLEQVHDTAYLEALRDASAAFDRGDALDENAYLYGFGYGDTPMFPGMWDAVRAVAGGSRTAAEAVTRGTPVAFHLAGGLHHAHWNRASGFCAVNDIALAIQTLRARYERVAYIDIDLHHGDGPQHTYEEDPDVLTASIHQFGNRFFPGTGHESERGVRGSVLNVPLPGGTDGLTWLKMVREALIPGVERFQPDAIVLQLGVDAHTSDPLGSLDVYAQDWLEAVRLVQGLGLPTLVLGGGGYDPRNPPRMWAAAVMTFMGVPVPDDLPRTMAKKLGLAGFFDHEDGPRSQYSSCVHLAEQTLARLREDVLPTIQGRE